MQKLLSLLFLLFSHNVASSQILISLLFGNKLNTEKLEFGLMISPTISKVTGMEGAALQGLGLGMYFNVKMNKRLFLHPEMNAKSVLGTTGLKPYTTGDANLDAVFLNSNNKVAVQRVINAISLPLMVRYRIKGLLFAELGPQVNWMFRAKDVFETKQNGTSTSYSKDINSELTDVDLGLRAGLEYKLKKDKGMGIGVRYYYGFTDVMKTIAGTQANSAWYFSIAIPIGVKSTK